MLVDSSFLCHRAKNTTMALSYGELRTGVIYGFFNQFFKLAEKLEPEQILFFWDSKKRKRREIYPGYKVKNRERNEADEEEWRTAFAQFRQLRKKILPDIGFANNFIQSGYEADDLIAQYVMSHPDEESNIVVTGDDDLLQLLDYCCIYNPAKGDFTYKSDFIWAHQIEPAMWAEVKKIAGCTSDCVPGVKGVGEPTALKYLRGELKRTTKAYQNIIDSKGVIDRNHKLVVLPFEGTKKIEAQNYEFSMIEFLRLCRKFGLSSFRHEEKKEKIKQLFTTKGKEDGNREKKKREKRRRNTEESSTEEKRKKGRSPKRRSTD